MNRVLVVAGGSISCNIMDKVSNWDYVIAADKGVKFCEELDIVTDMLVGDFDSATDIDKAAYESKGVKIYTYIPEKDLTDTHIAVYKALELSPKEILIIGATGRRMDHTLANIGMLQLIDKNGVIGTIVDEHNRMSIISHNLVIHKEDTIGTYISFIPYSNVVTGLSLRGFKYPLHNKTLYLGDSLGVSNELIEDIGYVDIKEGYLIKIESWD